MSILIKSNFEALSAFEQELDSSLQKLFDHPEAHFVRWPYEDHWDHITQRARWIWQSGNFDQVFWIGIGGSSLGARAITQVFSPSVALYFFENLDSGQWDQLEKLIKNLKRVHFVVVSKSGSTLETVLIFHQIKRRWSANLDPAAQVTIVTENSESIIRSLWDSSFVLSWPKGVGGRYSLLTASTLLPLLGTKISGEELSQVLPKRREDYQLLLPLLKLALFITPQVDYVYSFHYTFSPLLFGPWLVQLWNESLGKVRSPYPVLFHGEGSVDQHSTLQYLMEGPKRPWIIIWKAKNALQKSVPLGLESTVSSFSWTKGWSFDEIRGFQAEGTFEALSHQGRWVTLVDFGDMRPIQVLPVAYELLLWVALLGLTSQINPFDQPAVELSKKLTERKASLKSF